MSRDRRLPDPPANVSRQSVEPWQDPQIRAALDDWQGEVMLLDQLDPSTTEVVRLACATNHDCRFCRTVRQRVDGARVVDENVADLVTRRAYDLLSDRHAVAVRLSDAIMQQPGSIDPSIIDAARAHFTPVELVELALDVMKFSHQKINVTLGLDEPMHPDSSLVEFTIDTAGRPSFGG